MICDSDTNLSKKNICNNETIPCFLSFFVFGKDLFCLFIHDVKRKTDFKKVTMVSDLRLILYSE